MMNGLGGAPDHSKPKARTYHVGMSVYGPQADGRFRGAIAIDNEQKHGESYDTFEGAKLETLKVLEELVKGEPPEYPQS